MGYPRTDQLSGKEMINFYQIYVKSKDIKIQNMLFLHNRDDLKGMLSLLPLGESEKYLFRLFYCPGSPRDPGNHTGELSEKGTAFFPGIPLFNSCTPHRGY